MEKCQRLRMVLPRPSLLSSDRRERRAEVLESLEQKLSANRMRGSGIRRALAPRGSLPRRLRYLSNYNDDSHAGSVLSLHAYGAERDNPLSIRKLSSLN